MNGYEKRTEQKKATIIEAAQELFAQGGISGVSITDIAAKANVSRVTIFKYFGDKETLGKAAMQTWVEHLIKEFQDILASDLPYTRKLIKLFSTRIAGREKIGEQFISTVAWDDPEMRKLIYDMSTRCTLPIIINFIQEGRNTGYIDNSIGDEAIFAYLSAFGPIIQNPEYIKKGPAFQKDIFHLFMGGLIKGWHDIKNKQ